jgi:oxygen-independent coproporphyrinogen-3 oxidase
MTRRETLDRIRKALFYGSSDYTKNQPDLVLPHRFQMLAPSQVSEFLQAVHADMTGGEFLLYIHLPFCFSECLFCNSFPYPTDPRVQEEYLRNLLTEIDRFADSGLFAGKQARCVYFGGGTPTSFANADLARILARIRARVPLASACGITLEAHPGTLSDPGRTGELAGLGVSRISIGCQTFDPEILRLCNRRNTEAQARAVIENAHAAGIAVNIDMMSGLPGQTLASVRRDLSLLEQLRPDAVEYIRHEIVNPLAVSLYRERPELVVDNDTLFDLVLLTQEWMTEHGYEQNGRFRDARQWEYRYHWLNGMPIVALGVRARSYTETFCYDKHEDRNTYALLIAKGVPPVGRFIERSTRERMYRMLFLRLQIAGGLDCARFQERFGLSPRAAFKPLFDTLDRCGCIEETADCVRLTPLGACFVEDVCDYVVDAALREESGDLARTPHSEGSTSARLRDPARQAGKTPPKP